MTATILSTGLVADMVLLPALLLSVRPAAAVAKTEAAAGAPRAA